MLNYYILISVKLKTKYYINIKILRVSHLKNDKKNALVCN
jgi:hypothetical protein